MQLPRPTSFARKCVNTRAFLITRRSAGNKDALFIMSRFIASLSSRRARVQYDRVLINLRRVHCRRLFRCRPRYRRVDSRSLNCELGGAGDMHFYLCSFEHPPIVYNSKITLRTCVRTARVCTCHTCNIEYLETKHIKVYRQLFLDTLAATSYSSYFCALV